MTGYKPFSNRVIPAHIYDSLYVCTKRNCHSVLMDSTYSCPVCGRRGRVRLIAKCRRIEIALFAMQVLVILSAIWLLQYTLSFTHFWIWCTATLAFTGILVFYIVGRLHNYKRRVTIRFANELFRDQKIYKNYKSTQVSIDLSPLSDAQVYEQLRSLSYIYDDAGLKYRRLYRLMKIPFTASLDFETDTLVDSEYFNPDLLDYLYSVAKINPGKIGKRSVEFVLKHFDRATADENGKQKCARVLIAGLRQSHELVDFRDYYVKTRRVAQYMTEPEARAFGYSSTKKRLQGSLTASSQSAPMFSQDAVRRLSDTEVSDSEQIITTFSRNLSSVESDESVLSPIAQYAVVNERSAYLRKAPSALDSSIARLRRGDKVIVLDEQARKTKNTTWAKVRTTGEKDSENDSKIGYINFDRLTREWQSSDFER